MKLVLPLVCALALLLVTGCGGTKTVTKTVTVSDTAKSGAGSPRQVVEFGYVKSLKPKGSGYEMRFDPVSTDYAEFGSFVTGLVLEPAEALRRVGLG